MTFSAGPAATHTTAHTTGSSFARRATAALVSAITVAAIAYGATLLLFFVVGGAVATNLAQLHTFFIWSAVLTLVIAAILALVGGYSRWYTALAAGVITGAVAAVVGSTLSVVGTGTAFGGEVASYAVGTLIGPNLIFVVAVVLATVTVGRRIWTAIVAGGGADSGTRIAIVRPPADSLAEGELTHLERVPIDIELANAQWDGYVAALADHGWDVVQMPLANELADSVFVEDDVVIFGKTAVIASPGAESRRGETDAVERTVRKLGLKVAKIQLPGTLEGGDVLKVGKTIYVGRGGRTNSEGIRQLRNIVGPLGYSIVAVPVTMALHLKSSVTALPDGTIIGYLPVVDEPAIFDRFLAVPEITGVAVVTLSRDTVLMSASAPKSVALIADLGYTVITVDISEFEKLEGCITCLSVRVR